MLFLLLSRRFVLQNQQKYSKGGFEGFVCVRWCSFVCWVFSKVVLVVYKPSRKPKIQTQQTKTYPRVGLKSLKTVLCVVFPKVVFGFRWLSLVCLVFSKALLVL